MKYGIFGTLSTESESVDDAKFEENVMGEVSDEADYAEVCDMVASSESEYLSMEQATAVAAKLDVQHEITGELLEHPEDVTVGAVAMARESMDLALAVLGGRPSTEYAVSNESMVSSPLHALQVTHEGIGKTSKRIYEGIKMLFKRIALTIKKMAAKLVVMLNRTGKKAEKMLKAFKADKTAHATKSKLESDDATKILKKLSGYSALLEESGFGAKTWDVLAKNMKGIVAYNDLLTKMIPSLTKAVEEAGMAAGKQVLVDAVFATDNAKAKRAEFDAMSPEEMSEAIKKVPDALAAAKLASAEKLTAEGLSGLTGGKVNEFQIDESDDHNIPDEYEPDSLVFLPVYPKGDKIHGVLFYRKKLDDDERDDEIAQIASVKYINATVDAYDDDTVTTKTENTPVWSRDEINTELTSLKPASTQLKTFADARQRDIDKATKDINKYEKDRKGNWGYITRFRNSTYSRMRMFVAGNFVSSIFARAAIARAQLATAAIHISYYEDA